MTKQLGLFVMSCGFVVLAGCGGGDSDGDCSNVTACPLPDLSEAQQAAFCDTLLAAIDDPPGTTYECEESGLFLTVNTSAQCAATEYGAGCMLTGADLIACYKAAAEDVCAAFEETGACGELLASAEACL